MIDFDEIRKEIAIEHNTLLGKDDPIIMGVTLNEVVFRKYVEILVEQNMTHLKRLEEAQQKGIADAKITAGRVITEGGNYVSKRLTAAMSESEERIKEKFTNYLKGMDKMRYEAETSRNVTVTAAAVACLCAIGTVAFTLL